MTKTRTPIPELIGRTIVAADFVDYGSSFDVAIVTDDGHTIASGGWKADASASLHRGGETLKEWEW